ncbi:Mediator of RNA polymerase II transcription subunit 27, partial [Mucuna pruriens]
MASPMQMDDQNDQDASPSSLPSEKYASHLKIVSRQNSYSLLCRTFDSAMAECCHQESISLLAYSPLTTGILSGKYFFPGGGPTDVRLNHFKGKYSEGESRYNLSNKVTMTATVEYLNIAKTYGIHPVSLAIAFVLRHPLVASAIFGATKSWLTPRVHHVFRHITEYAATALQYFLGNQAETCLYSLWHWICSYQTLFSRPCSKCSRLLTMDKQSTLLLPPVNRSYWQFSFSKILLSNLTKDQNSNSTQAYHIGCLSEEV